jgi:hypothetical protein
LKLLNITIVLTTFEVHFLSDLMILVMAGKCLN